jgi:hypothetical protein
MTPLAGFVAAIIAGWYVRNARQAAAAIIVPFLVVLGVQTWSIAAGLGHSPPSTVTSYPGAFGYWLVQLIIVAFPLAIALELGALRARGVVAVQSRRRRAVVVSGALTLVAGILSVVYAVQTSPVAHHSANGSPPAWGIAGIGLGIVVAVVLGVLLLWRHRVTRRQAPGRVQGSAVQAAGRR